MPAVATPTVTFSARPGCDRKSRQGDLPVPGRRQRDVRPGLLGVRPRPRIPQGEALWNDDHLPATPTTQWKPGQTVEYTRTVFVPNYPYIGEANVRIGLYSQADGKRLVLTAPEASRREYTVAKVELLPQSENVFLIYKDGWHPAEVDAANPNSEWQWTQKRAAFSFRNPKKDVNFYLEYDARTDLFTPPQQVDDQGRRRGADDVHGRLARAEAARSFRLPPPSSAPATWSRWQSSSTRPSNPAAPIPASSDSASTTRSSSRSRRCDTARRVAVAPNGLGL